jgi:hypothetical protein
MNYTGEGLTSPFSSLHHGKMRTDVLSIRDVPFSWIYEFYLGIELQGNTTKTQSPLGPSDRRPSLSIHRHSNDGSWTWSDFRAGKKGGAPWLVYEMALEGKVVVPEILSIESVNKMIVRDYKQFLDSGGSYDLPEPAERWRFSGYGLRSWSTADRDFWSPFGLGSVHLERNCVAPLDWYAYEKENGSNEFKTEGIHLYGYFTKSGLLYKIYQPFVADKKYRKIRDHLEGSDNTNPKWKHTMVMSGKKDMMCFQLLGLEFNVICPDCETSILDLDPSIPILLDNDLAGHQAMARYREKGHKTINMGMEKDFALCVRNHPLDKVRDQFINAYINRK